MPAPRPSSTTALSSSWTAKQGSESVRELFDLRSDQAEKKNLIDNKPEIAKNMGQQLRDWQQSVLNSLTGADYR